MILNNATRRIWRSTVGVDDSLDRDSHHDASTR